MAQSITPEQIEQTFYEAIAEPQGCVRLIATLEALLPTLGPVDRLNMQKTITALRTYAAITYPELSDQFQTSH